MERDKTEIEIAIEYVAKRLNKAKSHSLIDSLAQALAALCKAKNDEEQGHL